MPENHPIVILHCSYQGIYTWHKLLEGNVYGCVPCASKGITHLHYPQVAYRPFPSSLDLVNLEEGDQLGLSDTADVNDIAITV